ncbi:DoxX-like protein [Chitinophaga polysaccharea]|uniref:DoxX-like protein n=1 Tax=Chitinophaga polysaccharea TaxID=1293035 RepID=A0A561PRH8_9BACT|nr:DoxX family protein [Chitinophaga polysaccharea]TWF40693.1 DoxX-like protein [Chitinophaga polysaccharea]
MTKRNKIIYWIATLWLALGMTSTAIVQLSAMKTENDFMAGLGYPPYFQKIIGCWKILGVIAILVPKFPLLKEWAYAGFFFAMSGALLSHIAVGGVMKDMFPSLLLLILTAISWYFRPADRRILSFN